MSIVSSILIKFFGVNFYFFSENLYIEQTLKTLILLIVFIIILLSLLLIFLMTYLFYFLRKDSLINFKKIGSLTIVVIIISFIIWLLALYNVLRDNYRLKINKLSAEKSLIVVLTGGKEE